jgi:aspartate/methionine/tyrosine aminotransferase
MSSVNPQAEKLNQVIENNNLAVLQMLSEKGKGIFFPKGGILKQSAEAKGKKFNATIGISTQDDGTPLVLPSLEHQIGIEPKNYAPYAPSFGLMSLRKKWQEKIKAKNPSLEGKDFSLPVVTSGLTHGLSTAAYLFLDPGDTLILPDKFWGNYKLIFQNGFESKLSTFNTFQDKKFDSESLAWALKESPKGKKVVLLNIPNNPTGYTPSEAEANQIVEVLKQSAEAGNEIVVICDDAYFGLLYEEGLLRESLFARLTDLHESILAVKLDGATKEEFAWGFRIAFITFGGKNLSAETLDAFEQKAAGAIRGNLSNCCHLSQSLLLNLFESETYEAEKQQGYRILQERYQEVRSVLQANKERFAPYFKPLPFNSGYFMCIELADNLESEQVRQKLLEEYDTGVIATGNLIRIAFSSIGKKQIPKLFENIFQACQSF